MKKGLLLAALLAGSAPALADDSKFSTHLQAKFQTKGCTVCHDFFDKERGGLAFKGHKGRGAEICIYCHTSEVTGFEHADEWFAQPGLYLSGMDAVQTCETTKDSAHAKFKNSKLVARQLEKHLLEDPRVLWAIEGATPKSGALPGGKKEPDLVKGGMARWRAEVTAWIRGGMKCE